MVTLVATVEREELALSLVRSRIMSILHNTLDVDGDMATSKEEIEMLLTSKFACEALVDVGVDVVGLVDLADFVFGVYHLRCFANGGELDGANKCPAVDVVRMKGSEPLYGFLLPARSHHVQVIINCTCRFQSNSNRRPSMRLRSHRSGSSSSSPHAV